MLQVTHSEHLTRNIKESERHFPAVDTEVTWQDLPSVEGVVPVPTLDIVLIALLLSVDFVLPGRMRLVAQSFHDLDLPLRLDGSLTRPLDGLRQGRRILLESLFESLHGDRRRTTRFQIERRQGPIVHDAELGVAGTTFVARGLEAFTAGTFGREGMRQLEATGFEFVLAQVEHALQSEAEGAGHQSAAAANPASSASVWSGATWSVRPWRRKSSMRWRRARARSRSGFDPAA